MTDQAFGVWAIGDGITVNPRNGNLWTPDLAAYDGPPIGAHRMRNGIWDAGTNTVSLRSGRNEAVGFQVVICSAGRPLRSVNVRVEGMPGLTANLFREKYVPIGRRWYADPLLPFEVAGVAPFSVPDPEAGIPDQSNQAVWIDLYVSPDAPARSEGAVVITAEGQVEVRLRLELEVLPISLPTDVHVDCELNCYGGLERQVGSGDALAADYLALERSYYRMAHDHRANLNILPYLHNGNNHPGFVPPLTGEGAAMRVADWTGYDAHFGPYFDGSAFAECVLPARPAAHQYLAFHLCWPSAFEHWGTERFRQENQAVLREFVDHAIARGWTRTEFQVYYNEKPKFGYFPFEMDEPRTAKDLEALTRVSEIVRDVTTQSSPARFVFRVDIDNYEFIRRKLGGKIDLFNVSAGIELGGFDWADHWGRTTGHYNVESIQAAQAKGARGWFYGGAGRIDFSPLILRRFGSRAWRWQADGFCLWCVDMWGPDPYHHVLDEEPGQRGFDFIYYPGGPVGAKTPIPSIRLKALRRGLQDYEYMWLLAERKGDRGAPEPLLCDDQDTDPEAWDNACDRLASAVVE